MNEPKTEPEFDELEHRFKHHAPLHHHIASRFSAIRQTILNAARIVDDLCPPGRDRSLATTKLEEAMFWASAAIARNQDEIMKDMVVTQIMDAKTGEVIEKVSPRPKARE